MKIGQTTFRSNTLKLLLESKDLFFVVSYEAQDIVCLHNHVFDLYELDVCMAKSRPISDTKRWYKRKRSAAWMEPDQRRGRFQEEILQRLHKRKQWERGETGTGHSTEGIL